MSHQHSCFCLLTEPTHHIASGGTVSVACRGAAEACGCVAAACACDGGSERARREAHGLAQSDRVLGELSPERVFREVAAVAAVGGGKFVSFGASRGAWLPRRTGTKQDLAHRKMSAAVWQMHSLMTDPVTAKQSGEMTTSLQDTQALRQPVSQLRRSTFAKASLMDVRREQTYCHSLGSPRSTVDGAQRPA